MFIFLSKYLPVLPPSLCNVRSSKPLRIVYYFNLKVCNRKPETLVEKEAWQSWTSSKKQPIWNLNTSKQYVNCALMEIAVLVEQFSLLEGTTSLRRLLLRFMAYPKENMAFTFTNLVTLRKVVKLLEVIITLITQHMARHRTQRFVFFISHIRNQYLLRIVCRESVISEILEM